jgi:hypothetical protein
MINEMGQLHLGIFAYDLYAINIMPPLPVLAFIFTYNMCALGNTHCRKLGKYINTDAWLPTLCDHLPSTSQYISLHLSL